MSAENEFFPDLERGCSPLAEARARVEAARRLAVEAVQEAEAVLGELYLDDPALPAGDGEWRVCRESVNDSLIYAESCVEDDAAEGFDAPTPDQTEGIEALKAALAAIDALAAAWAAQRAVEMAELAAAGAVITLPRYT